MTGCTEAAVRRASGVRGSIIASKCSQPRHAHIVKYIERSYDICPRLRWLLFGRRGRESSRDRTLEYLVIGASSGPVIIL